MIYKDRSVPIPEGKIVISREYVYLTLESTYMPEKKYNTHKRVMLGKTSDGLTMHPNDNYYIHFPDSAPEEEPVQEKPHMSEAVHIGACALTQSISESLGLPEKLSAAFGEDAPLIEDLAAYFCTAETSVLQHYPSWRYDHPGYPGTDVSDCTCGRLLHNGITESKIDCFLKLWNENRDKTAKMYINVDSTNMGCTADGVELKEYGHAKDDPTIPQVNLAMASQCDSCLPLLYDLYPGSITDMSEFEDFINMIRRYGYTNLGAILDRGYVSLKNITDLRKDGFDCILMLKDTMNITREVIQENFQTLQNGFGCVLPCEKDTVYGVTVYRKVFASSEEHFWLHVYYAPHKAADTRALLHTQVMAEEAELKMLISTGGLDEKAAKKYAKHFNLELHNGKVTGYTPNWEKLNELNSLAGCWVIATTEEMSAAEALRIYRNRDEIEKLFESIKDGMDGRKFRVHSDLSLSGKVFVFFIASILRSQIYRGLKELKTTERDWKRYTVPAVLKELDKIIAVEDGRGVYRRRRVLTGHQKKILKHFNITESEINNIVGRL